MPPILAAFYAPDFFIIILPMCRESVSLVVRPHARAQNAFRQISIFFDRRPPPIWVSNDIAGCARAPNILQPAIKQPRNTFHSAFKETYKKGNTSNRLWPQPREYLMKMIDEPLLSIHTLKADASTPLNRKWPHYATPKQPLKVVSEPHQINLRGIRKC